MVYKAKNIETGRLYAVKEFDKKSLGDDETNRDLLVNEMEIMRMVDHRSVMRFYEVHETEGFLYFVMELLEGCELYELIEDFGCLELGDAARIMKQLLEGLVHLAEKNIIHRDIKPENLVMRWEECRLENNEIVICDFGLSTLSTDRCEDLILKQCGTPGYIAPEMLDQGDDEEFRLTCAADMFSMGIIFYIL